MKIRVEYIRGRMTEARSKIRNRERAVISDFSSLHPGFYINHCDALGSPRKMTNESGTVVWTGAYQPFGEMITGSGNVHGFTGKEVDSEMGLNYFCQRYYDPQLGRFMTLDPFGGYIELPQTQMRYGYCVNNPLKYIDPLGLNPPMEWLWDENIAWTCYDDICIGVWTPPPIPPLHRIPDASSDEGLIGADEDAYSDPYGGGTGGYLGGRRRRSGYNPYGGGGQPGHSGTPAHNIVIGFQFQAQATFLWWGMSWGQTYIITPAEQRGWYFFMEPNKGFGLGIGLGPIVAWGSGPLTGDMADFSGGGGPIIISIFDNGLMKSIFFGYNWGVPITVSSGLMTTEEMDNLEWP